MLQNQEWSVGQGHWSGGRRFKNAFSVANCDALFLFIKLMSCLDSLRREGYIKDEHSPTLWISLLLYALSFLLSCFSGVEAIFQSWRKDDALAIRSQSRYRGAALIGFGRIHLNWLKVQIFTLAFDKLLRSLKTKLKLKPKMIDLLILSLDKTHWWGQFCLGAKNAAKASRNIHNFGSSASMACNLFALIWQSCPREILPSITTTSAL